MLRPRIQAPMWSMPRAAKSSSMPVVPSATSSMPSMARRVFVGKTHVQGHAADAHRVVEALRRPGAKTIDREPK
jgi:hypothetical protein